MKKLWFPFLALVLFLVGCASDKTLDTLIPRKALAVILLDHPSLAAPALVAEGALPWASLETGKPWAAAAVAVPNNPPGFILALALADKPTAWQEVDRWAHERGGLASTHLGSYAVLSSPGLPEPGELDPDSRFDLSRVRVGGDVLAIYVDIKNVMDEADLPDALRPAFFVLPWAEKNLSGLRLGFAPKEGGLELRIATDWKPDSDGPRLFRGWSVPVDPATWTGSLPTSDGVGAVFSLPEAAWQKLGAIADQPLSRRWASLAPLVGPRASAVATPGSDGSWGWTLSVESRDSQAVRQALKTLVAGGELQRNFASWALDADTPLIYRDNPGAGGSRASVTLGPSTFQIAYEKDRVVFAGGTGSDRALTLWKETEKAQAAWVGQAPSGASALGIGALDGLGAKAAFRVLADSNVEFRLWIDATGVKAWEERFPQALMGWLSGPGGWTRAEP